MLTFRIWACPSLWPGVKMNRPYPPAKRNFFLKKVRPSEWGNWLSKKGSSSYSSFLTDHPMYSLEKAFYPLKAIVESQPGSLCPPPDSPPLFRGKLHTQLAGEGLFFLWIFLTGIMTAYGLVQLFLYHKIQFLIPCILAVLVLPQTFLLGNFYTHEFSREALWASMSTRLGLFSLIFYSLEPLLTKTSYWVSPLLESCCQKISQFLFKVK